MHVLQLGGMGLQLRDSMNGRSTGALKQPIPLWTEMPSMIGSLHWVSRKLAQMASLRNQDLGFKGQGPPAQCPDGA
jgi:hypothetical protein